MNVPKTTATDINPADWLEQVEPERRRVEGRELDALFREVTGWQPRMLGGIDRGLRRL